VLDGATVRLATDGHRLHYASASGEQPEEEKATRWILAPIGPSTRAARYEVGGISVTQIRRAADLAQAISARDYYIPLGHRSRSSSTSVSSSKERPHQVAAGLQIGAPETGRGCLVNAKYLLDAVKGCKTPSFFVGGTGDPVIVRRDDGGVAIVMPQRFDPKEDLTTWPRVGLVMVKDVAA
jgi:hypothetical protein